MSDNNENPTEAQEDENPWDDDEGARTVATGAPTDLPSNLPSPITNPPPAMPVATPAPIPAPMMPKAGGVPPKKVGKATMIGIAGPAPGAVAPPDMGGGVRAPMGVRAPAAPSPPAMPAAPRSTPPLPPRAGAPSSQRVPTSGAMPPRAPSVPDSDPPDAQKEDGPTMAVAPDAMNALGAEAMAQLREAVRRHSQSPQHAAGGALDEPADETTRAVAREELMRDQQDGHVVVGEDEDAVGDEATLAVAPGQVDLGPGGGEIAAALAATLGPPNTGYTPNDPPPGFPAPPPKFPPPPGAQAQHAPHPGSNPQIQAAPNMNMNAGATGAMPSYRGQPPVQAIPQSNPHPQSQSQPHYEPAHAHAPYDPMMPGGPQQPQYSHAPQQGGGGYPSSGQHPASANMPMSQPYPGSQPQPPMMMMGPNPGAPTGMVNAPPPPWMTQPSPPPAGMVGGFKITPQIIALAIVGVCCLAIFVVGIVLFVQTKFN